MSRKFLINTASALRVKDTSTIYEIFDEIKLEFFKVKINPDYHSRKSLEYFLHRSLTFGDHQVIVISAEKRGPVWNNIKLMPEEVVNKYKKIYPESFI